MEEALEHIATFGSQHTEAIVTKDYARQCDSCVRWMPVGAGECVGPAERWYHSAWAEIGISTSRLREAMHSVPGAGSGQIRE